MAGPGRKWGSLERLTWAFFVLVGQHVFRHHRLRMEML